jgi:hypothetical protein
MFIQIEVKKDLGDYKAGDIISVASHDGVPIDNFWRRRLQDATFDDCCSIVKPAVKEEVTKNVSYKTKEKE